MKSTIFFDIGNVLVYFSHEKMCKQIADFCDVSLSQIHSILFDQGLGASYELGSLNSADFHKKFVLLLKKDIDMLGLMKAGCEIFQPNTEIIPIIDELKKRGTRLIMLSNTCEAHFNYVYSRFDVLQYFDDKILSYEVGLRKPDLKIYQKALTLAQNAGSSCFYTDDIPEYVMAARNIGLDSETFQSVPQLRKDLKIRGFL